MIVSGFECVSLSVPSPIGRRCGVQIVNSAWVRFRNTGVKAAVHTGGKSNAAMVLENSFWQWFEEGSSFAFRCDGKSDCRGLPSVILRGNNETFAFVRTVYACVRGPGGSTCIYNYSHSGSNRAAHADTTRTVCSFKFDRVTLSGGGFQYIQDG